MHNRLTHSEKVAQVARSIGEHLIAAEESWPLLEELGGLDVDVCEAAGLAHDLGHPPFGHIGEEVLDLEARMTLGLTNGFEGNAQSFRMVSLAKIRSSKYEGLDPTRATLAAIAKYPWTRTPTLQDELHASHLKMDGEYRRKWKKFNAYDCQGKLLEDCRAFASGIGSETQTIEASVMDAADDITYAIHDLEDFYLGGIIDVAAIREDLDSFLGREGAPRATSFTTLRERLKIDYPDYLDEEEFESAAAEVSKHLKMGMTWRHSSLAQVEARARGMGSDLIGHYINAIHVAREPLWHNGPHVGLQRPQWHEVQLWKEITRSYVIQRPDIALLQRGQQTILERLVEMLNKWVDGDRTRLPPRLREEVEIAEGLQAGTLTSGYGKDAHAPRGEPKRAILDYICTLTDAQCTALYQKLSGMQVHRVSLGGIF